VNRNRISNIIKHQTSTIIDIFDYQVSQAPTFSPKIVLADFIDV
jgi:hypothetical protein